jgi:hypothetical protein
MGTNGNCGISHANPQAVKPPAILAAAWRRHTEEHETQRMFGAGGGCGVSRESLFEHISTDSLVVDYYDFIL